LAVALRSMAATLSASIGSAPFSVDMTASATRRPWPMAKPGSSASAASISASGSTK
jgi:hypothetical protein